ncbi:MAG: hypothetical protein C5S49_07800 [Candidatus Methanogaster sp.]|nr:MAG: hypothetical protein C5S49_07800 [ANME-2 cluster archaeon]
MNFAAGMSYTIVEAESILLARELGADLLLINERDGRRAAKNAGVKVKGMIGVISDCIERRRDLISISCISNGAGGKGKPRLPEYPNIRITPALDCVLLCFIDHCEKAWRQER